MSFFDLESEPKDEPNNKGCRALVQTAVCLWVAILFGLWFFWECPPPTEEQPWTECLEPDLGGWLVLSLLAVPVALVLTTLVFAGIRLLTGPPAK